MTVEKTDQVEKMSGIRSGVSERVRRWRGQSSPDRPSVVGVYIILGVVLVAAGILSPVFFNPKNILNVLRQASALGIMSVGQTMVLIGGGVDLSIVSTMQLAAIVGAAVSNGRNDLVPLAIFVCLLLGAGVGIVNGLLITRWNVPAFIATLSVSIVTTGVRLVATYGAPPGSVPPLLRLLGHDRTGPIPNAVLLFAGFALLGSFVMDRTVFGRKVYATGGNRVAARLAGIAVDRVQLITFTISGVLAAIAGLVLVGYLGYADQWIGGGTQLDSIAAPIIGGASFAGGIGSIGGTVVGVLLVSILLNLVLLLSLPAEWQYIVRGLVVILAVAMHAFVSRERE
jgi:ribose/xylose/arabinose/galactoside ABC-type transport system permease subunit